MPCGCARRRNRKPRAAKPTPPPAPRLRGCRPDPHDPCDHTLRIDASEIAPGVDLRPLCSPVEQHGNLNSSTAAAVAAAVELLSRTRFGDHRNLSGVFLNFTARTIDNTVNGGSGVCIRTALKAAARYGICDRKLWPADIRLLFRRPRNECFHSGRSRPAIEYARVGQGDGVRRTLTRGLSVCFGMDLHERFDSVGGSTGVVPMPTPGETVVGRHAMLIVGMADDHYIVRNSRGGSWGENGYCRIPMALVDDPARAWSFWTVLSVERPDDAWEVRKP